MLYTYDADFTLALHVLDLGLFYTFISNLSIACTRKHLFTLGALISDLNATILKICPAISHLRAAVLDLFNN